MGGKGSKHIDTPNFFTQLPKDLQRYFFTQFLDVKSYVKLRQVCYTLKQYVDNEENIWRTFLTQIYPQHAEQLNPNKTFRQEFIRITKETHANYWIEVTKRTNTFTNKNRTAIHGSGTYYFPVRAKHGYSKGVHYWEVTPTKCEHSCYNTYIGFCKEGFDKLYCLGKDSHSWAIKGHKGEFLYNNEPIDTAQKTFNNGDKVGILLDLDKGTANFYINKQLVLSFSSKDLIGSVIYPAASSIVDPEELTINFNVVPPKQ